MTKAPTMIDESPVPTRGKLLWCGEHWIAYLRPTVESPDNGMVSLYHAYTSPAGAGTAAFVQIEGEAGFTGLCTDNEEFAQFVRETQVVPSSPFDLGMPVAAATLKKEGDIRARPCWSIQAGDRRIVATWSDLQTPLVGPRTANPRIVFTILVFTDGATIEVDGHRVDGVPYPRDVWKKSFGAPMSSCVFALAETMVRE